MLTFRGNTSTRPETAERYLLRRASELTLESGFHHFVTVSERDRTRASSIGYSGSKLPFVAPTITMKIRCIDEKPTEDDSVVDAADFLRFNYPEALEKIRASKK